jgi:hypothetical protein
MTTNFPQLRFRQVHLDFHTSEYCKDVGAEFDEDQFIESLELGRVNSITIFATCHHGWAYYPTKTDMAHPNLKTDLLGRMLKAGKKAKINMPVYITVRWNDKASREHPEWVIRNIDGSMMGPDHSHPQNAKTTGPTWYMLCLNSPYLEEIVVPITEEISQLYNPSGFFFDITNEHECTCNWCMETMEKNGLDYLNKKDRIECSRIVYKNYLKRVTEIVWNNNPSATIYHNGKDKMGRYDLYPYWSHHEIESLPTSNWGYNYFPTFARYFTNVPEFDFLGQTGKFHSLWGEIGGFKNPTALKYEVAHMISLGGKCLVGDQLDPRGKMNSDTYKMIGEAYEYVEQREPWLEDTTMVADVAILSATALHEDNDYISSDMGASSMLMQKQILFTIIDQHMDFSQYRLLILPDEILVDHTLKSKLEDFIKQGGALILTNNSGLNWKKDSFAIDCGLEYTGNSSNDVEYIEAHQLSEYGLVKSPFLVYESGITSRVMDAKILANTWSPEFNRTVGKFCGHRNTPYDRLSEHPSVVKKHNIIHIAQPLFRVYEKMGMQLHRDLFHACMQLVYTDPLLEVDLKSAGRASLMGTTKNDRMVLHLLYASPITRGEIEVIEDIVPLYDIRVSLRMDESPNRVTYVPENKSIEFKYELGRLNFVVDKLEMHSMIEIS